MNKYKFYPIKCNFAAKSYLEDINYDCEFIGNPYSNDKDYDEYDGNERWAIAYDGNIIAYLSCYVRSEADLYIICFGIDTKYQGQGHCKYIFNGVKQIAKDMKMKTISVYVDNDNVNAIHAYKSVGFDFGHGEPIIRLNDN
jgi:ribosomal protein S18 acetylase RimI-like enzyme